MTGGVHTFCIPNALANTNRLLSSVLSSNDSDNNNNHHYHNFHQCCRCCNSMDELVDELSGTTLDGDAHGKDTPMKCKNNKSMNRTASIINRSKMLMLSDSESDDDPEPNTLDRRRLTKHSISKHTRPGNGFIPAWKTRTSTVYPSSTTTRAQFGKGKRKRNSASEVFGSHNATSLLSTNVFGNSSVTSSLHSSTTDTTLNRLKSDWMDCDSSSNSSFTDGDGGTVSSDESPIECNFDGDDEQSDFYDSSSGAHQHHSHHHHHHHRARHYHLKSKLDSGSVVSFKKPTNPFFAVELDSTPSSTSSNSHHHHSHSTPSALSLWKRRRPLH